MYYLIQRGHTLQEWNDNVVNFVGVTVNFKEADDYLYDLPVEEWMRFITKVYLMKKVLEEAKDIDKLKGDTYEYKESYKQQESIYRLAIIG